MTRLLRSGIVTPQYGRVGAFAGLAGEVVFPTTAGKLDLVLALAEPRPVAIAVFVDAM